MAFLNKKTMVLTAILILAVFVAGKVSSFAGSDELMVTQQATQGSAHAAVGTPPLVQVGPWYPYPGNQEEPYANLIRASAVNWSGGDWDTQKLFDAGHLSPVTGLPVSVPKGTTLTTDVFFTAQPRTIYDGDWVLEWDGKADVSLLYLNDKMVTWRQKGRIEFSRDAASGKTPWHMAIQVHKVKEPMTGLRLFRAENEKTVKLGKIFSPRFIDAIKPYHVVRSMDLQEVNRSAITRIEDVASMSACCWDNYTWANGQNDQGRPFRSMPLEALFTLAVEADNQLWHQVPLELGAPKQLHDPSIMTDDIGKTLDAWSDLARQNADEILASAEWDRYADAFVAALIASGYPADRPLYSALSNEVWNFAGQYNASSRYAYGLGNGLRANGNFRHGLGAVSARWKLALDAALARAGRAQAVVYVVEGQAANQSTTYDALVGMQSYMEGQGEIWADHAGDIGISVASYWGSKPAWGQFKTPEAWERAIRLDPEGTAREFADFYINGSHKVLATKAWVLKQFAAHVAEGEKFGVKLIGAYEGGSHDERPSYISKEWYLSYHWGEHGARVNIAVNDALAEAYPGIILSNYVLAGPTGGQPWFDGAYGENTKLQQSWDQYHRQE